MARGVVSDLGDCENDRYNRKPPPRNTVIRFLFRFERRRSAAITSNGRRPDETDLASERDNTRDCVRPGSARL
ncbi:hypothetical protein GWI33_015001 [Rhynchophorus ferrugineus]|uniref:Uncharacterized protein n=1 Tax=Rhynchophorus ferrugineus TaxID=354439 RepID=A0A834I0K0_RHYFE|nr:hypothetical protein GWI33_015001 [Rhynchophorus ferrugineus]